MSDNNSASVAVIRKLLSVKHSKGDFITFEVNCGSKSQRMDAWALEGGWSKQSVTAYEIKLTRADFLQDKKWPIYLEYCNRLYFVAPKGVIERDEIPESCGLMELASTGTRLITRKKAPFRQVLIPQDMWVRALWRSREEEESETSLEDWKTFLLEKDDKKIIGAGVGYKISRMVSERCNEIISENQKLKRSSAESDRVVKDLKEAGLIEGDDWIRLTQKARSMVNGTRIDSGMVIRIRRQLDSLSSLVREVENMVETQKGNQQ